MPIPTRSRSLRHPAFSQREVLDATEPGYEKTVAAGDQPSTKNVCSSSQSNAGLAPVKNFSSTKFHGSEIRGATIDAKERHIASGRIPSPIRKQEPHRTPPGEFSSIGSKTSKTNYQTPDETLQPSGSQINRSSSLRQPTTSGVFNGQSHKIPNQGKGQSAAGHPARFSGLRSATAAPLHSDLQSSTGDPEAAAQASGNKTWLKRSVTTSHRRTQSGTNLATSKAAPTNNPPSVRPHFSTYQQHYTPKKSFRAPTQAVHHINPDNTPEKSTSVELARLEDEAFQLSVLHSSSYATQRSWEQGAEAKLRQLYDNVDRRQKDVLETEQLEVTNGNLTGLAAWVDEGSVASCDKIQTLSECIRDVSSLTRPDGLIERVVEQFQSWFKFANDIKNSRTARSADHQDMFTCIQPLEHRWRDQAEDALYKLEVCQRQLESLGPADESAAIGKLLHIHKHVVSDMSIEIESMVNLEKVVMHQEKQWRGETISRLLRSTDDESVSHTPALHRRTWNVA